MSGKKGLWLFLLAFLCIFATLAPKGAHAQNITDDCTGSKAQLDTQITANRQGFAQQLFVHSQNLNSMIPVIQALDVCIQNLTKIFAMLPLLANPLNILAAVIIGLAVGLITAACQAVVATITNAINALVSYAKICLPLPNFTLGLDRNLFPTAPGCSGGIQLNLLTTYGGAASNPPVYNYQQWLHQ